MSAQNKMKYKKEIWLVLAFMMPVVWFLILSEYLKTGCVSIPEAEACGQLAPWLLAGIFIFHMAFPIIYLVKVRPKNKKD